MKVSLKRRLHNQGTSNNITKSNDVPPHTATSMESKQKQSTMDTSTKTPTLESRQDHDHTNYVDSTETKGRRRNRKRNRKRNNGDIQWPSLRPQNIKKWVGGKAASVTRLKVKRWDVQGIDGVGVEKNKVSCDNHPQTKDGISRNQERETRQEEPSSSIEVKQQDNKSVDNADDGKTKPKRRWWMKSSSSSLLSSSKSLSLPRIISRPKSKNGRGSENRDVDGNVNRGLGEFVGGDTSPGNTSVEQAHTSDDEENDRTMSTTSSSSGIANDHHSDIVLGPLFPSSFVVDESHNHPQHHHYCDQIWTRDAAAAADDDDDDNDGFEDCNDCKYLKYVEKELSNEISSSLPSNEELDPSTHAARSPDQLGLGDQNTDGCEIHPKLADDSNTNIRSDRVVESDDDNERHGKPFQFDKSEVISLLFPLGYPSARKTTDSKMDPSNESKNVIATTMNALSISERRNDTHVGNLALRSGRRETSCSLDGTVESLLRDEATLDSSTDTPPKNRINRNSSNKKQKGTRHASNTDSSKDHAHTRGCKKKGPHHGVSSSDVIGKEISFDPTWDLLDTEPDNLSVLPTRRSKLQKLQKIEQYTDSLLEKFKSHEKEYATIQLSADYDEDSSVKMLLDLVDDYDQSIGFHSHQPNNGDAASLDTKFELGWHFDPVVFPEIHVVPDEEFEIIFALDNQSCDNDATTNDTKNVVLTNAIGCDETNLAKKNEFRECRCFETATSGRRFGQREFADTEYKSAQTHGTTRSYLEPDVKGEESAQSQLEIDQYPIDLPVQWLMPLSPINSDAGSALSALDLSLPLPSMPPEPARNEEEDLVTSSDRVGRDVFDIIDDESDGIPSCYRSTDSDECFYW
mmetsp:Transcript_57343/g.139877  ORF Transcript_57343/g.139877 Transcript_57343/m.139877 type:complete len:858 (+) Transcript_57343:459-3032(+)